ncbi:hypothetical protein PspLS_10161 [Pyricularia sp. CBS 133598]|nr:hypothetical protein PspLS_10161 [Pyricularia sp. CBS 133598]
MSSATARTRKPTSLFARSTPWSNEAAIGFWARAPVILGRQRSAPGGRKPMIAVAGRGKGLRGSLGAEEVWDL